jgi:hypothetical protein
MSSCYSKGFPSTNLGIIYSACSILGGRSNIETCEEYETAGTVWTNDPIGSSEGRIIRRVVIGRGRGQSEHRSNYTIAFRSVAIKLYIC